MIVFIFQFLNHYYMNTAKFSYATVALKQQIAQKNKQKSTVDWKN
jgi:hypothetical protein